MMVWFITFVSMAFGATGESIAKAAVKLEDPSVQYIPSYIKISYPLGDVPRNTGVCTDVVIRTFRGVGIDLQLKIHEDILNHPDRYPNVKKPDTNIDHRRVPNLGTFFKHHGQSIPVTQNPDDYLPGDIIWWKLGSPNGLNHIGVVVDQYTSYGKRPMVIHNIGGGQVIEDILFDHHIVAHYRYLGE